MNTWVERLNVVCLCVIGRCPVDFSSFIVMTLSSSSPDVGTVLCVYNMFSMCAGGTSCTGYSYYHHQPLFILLLYVPCYKQYIDLNIRTYVDIKYLSFTNELVRLNDSKLTHEKNERCSLFTKRKKKQNWYWVAL